MPEHRRLSSGHRADGEFTQKLMSAVYHKNRSDGMVSSAGVWDRARLEATAAPHSGAWLDALPSCALDTQLSNAEIQYGVGRRLGVVLCEQAPCPLCLGVMDKWGAHCESCMSGGDKTVTHHKIRDDLYLQARKARTAPRHEAVGIARLLGLEVGRETQERPADVLLCWAQYVTA